MRILIVEDDERIVGFIKRGLEAEQHEVVVALDGETGISLAETSPFDLVLLDVYLPRMNGLEVCRHLRARYAAIPIFVMTAMDLLEIKENVIPDRRTDYLQKPFSFEFLLSKINALCPRE